MKTNFSKRSHSIRFDGRILFLTEDLETLRRQIKGETFSFDVGQKLLNNISTDEITPGWVCFYYDETLGEFVYVGLRGNAIKRNDVKRGGFSVVVSGISKGCGSSRETAPYAEKHAGIELVIAQSIEKIYGQNAHNIGLLTSTDFSLIPRILKGEAIELSEFTQGLDPISASIVEYGGLFPYNQARMSGQVKPTVVHTPERPMTLTEKILAAHTVIDLSKNWVGVPAVKPGDALFVKTDVRFSHEYVTPMAESLFVEYLGKDAKVTEPESVYAFRDHLTFLREVMPKEHREMGLLERANGLATSQADFTARQGIRLYGEVFEGGSEAICHNAVLEDIAHPGQVIAGTDSHTCTAGALGCFAFGVGSTDMANAWYTRDVRVKVPETVRFELIGKKSDDVSAKDIMLYILATDYVRQGKAIGQVMEFSGDGLAHLPLDEQATLTNMAVEGGGFTGIIEPNETTIAYLMKMRGLSRQDIEAKIVRTDPGAKYAAIFTIDVSSISPMVALPGDPRNGIPISDLEKTSGEVKIDIAYGGSCTGGKIADMDMYAKILQKAVEHGKKVAPNVQLFIQFGSQKIKAYAEKKGYLQLFEQAGATLINPSCGACIKAGPGVSLNDKQVTVSAINRNFPGRSGPGKVYLASPLVVAASALAGRIVPPNALF